MKVHEHSRNAFLRGGPRRAALALMGALMAAAPAMAAAPFGPWEARLLRDHPLVGRIIDARTLKPLSREELEKRLAGASIVILGEVHDNPDHHRIQGWLLRAFAKGRARPLAVVFEMIPTDKAPVMAALRGAKRLSANAVFDIVNWEKSGWPARVLYAPVMAAAVEVGGLPRPAGLPGDQVRAVGTGGLKILARDRIAALKLAPLPEETQAALEKDIVKSHCDMIPRKAARAMSGVQRLRDALMAAETLKAWRDAGAAALVAGDGHARKDRAVPFYLRRHAGAPAPLVIWQAEARKGAKSLKDLLPKDAAPARLADVFIITPRAKREDPCARFRDFMRRKNHGKKTRD